MATPLRGEAMAPLIVSSPAFPPASLASLTLPAPATATRPHS